MIIWDSNFFSDNFSPNIMTQAIISNRSLWIDIIKGLQLTIKRADIVALFQNTALKSYDSGVLTVAVPNIFSKDWLENKYASLVIDTAKTLNPEVHKVEFELDSTLGSDSDLISINVLEVLESKQKVRKVPNKQEMKVVGSEVRSKYLNPKYTLDSYIVGKENRLAHAACTAVARQPGSSYNPLFIYGGVGLGKTHLLQATGNEMLKQHPGMQIVYISSENFINEIVYAIKNFKTKEFKRKYRSVDCFIIDDVQFFANKETSQLEFFHTFNDLYDNNKQIIVSSDRPPKELNGLQDRICSRFEMGMIVDVDFPDFETRLAILYAKCRENEVIVDPEVLECIAYNVHHSIRELEGVLMHVIAITRLEGASPTIRDVAQVLRKLNRDIKMNGLDIDNLEPACNAVSSDDVLNIVSDYFKLTKMDVIGPRRSKEIMTPRQIAIYLIRKELRYSYEKIGEEFGGRNHTTIMHSYEKITDALKRDRSLIRDVNAIKKAMGL